MFERDLADRGELLVAALAGADVPGVDAVLVECVRGIGETRQSQMAVVVKIPDDRGLAARVEHSLFDVLAGLPIPAGVRIEDRSSQCASSGKPPSCSSCWR